MIYARASSAEHKEKLERQVERLVQYCTLRGYEARTGGQGNCLRGERQPPETLGVALRSAGHRIVVEHKDRFGFRYLETLLEYKVEPLKSRMRADNDKEDLIADLVASVYSLTARLYGQRRAKRKTERIAQELQTEEKHEAC